MSWVYPWLKNHERQLFDKSILDIVGTAVSTGDPQAMIDARESIGAELTNQLSHV
jgi:hypothetical protein